MDFTFSDTVFGHVVAGPGDKEHFTIKTIDGRSVNGQLTSTCYARYVFNLDEGWHDAGGDMHDLIKKTRRSSLRLWDILSQWRRDDF